MARPKTKYKNNYRKNHGVPGVVYILDNPGLREGIIKIGCSRRSGEVRARQLNFDASTGTPGTFRCVFECPTDDCGKAEERVFEKLVKHRRGKWGQEYFEVALDHAKEIIIQTCSDVDNETEKQHTQLGKAPSSDSVNVETDSLQIESTPILSPLSLNSEKQIQPSLDFRKFRSFVSMLLSEALNLLVLGLIIIITAILLVILTGTV
jgi:hypothetical protein